MKAIACTKYGPPDVLQLKEVERPAPRDKEVLIKVHATSANLGDCHLLRGELFFIRLMGFGLLKPKHQILGTDVAGRVEAVGRNLKQFRSGDEVFGDIFPFGALVWYNAVSNKSKRKSWKSMVRLV